MKKSAKAVPMVVIERVKVKKTLTEALSYILQSTNDTIETLEKKKAEFVQRFNEDVIGAITWQAENMMNYQHQCHLAKDVQYVMSYAAQTVGFFLPVFLKSPNCKPSEVALKSIVEATNEEIEKILVPKLIENLKIHMQERKDRIVQKAMYPARSTSIVSNCNEQQEVSAIANSVDSLGSGINRYVYELEWVLEAH